jgi:hypothetical protein
VSGGPRLYQKLTRSQQDAAAIGAALLALRSAVRGAADALLCDFHRNGDDCSQHNNEDQCNPCAVRESLLAALEESRWPK